MPINLHDDLRMSNPVVSDGMTALLPSNGKRLRKV